jgi:hypothetical protein
MDLKHARDLYQADAVSGFFAVRYDPGHGGPGELWSLRVWGRAARSWDITTALGKTKTYVTLDAVAKDVERISYRVMSVQFEQECGGRCAPGAGDASASPEPGAQRPA